MKVGQFGSVTTRLYRNSGIILLVRGAGATSLLGLHLLLGNYLGAFQYGVFSFAVACCGLVVSFASLGTPSAYSRFIAQYSNARQWDRLKGVSILLPSISMLSIGIFSSILYMLSHMLYGDVAAGLGLSAVLLPAFGIDQIRRAAFRGGGMPVASAMPDDLVRPLLMMVLVAIFSISQARDVIYVYFLLSVGVSTPMLGFLWMKMKSSWGTLKPYYAVRSWMRVALPMAISSAGYIVMNRTDAVMLGAMSEMDAVGVYAASSRIALLIDLVLGAATVVVAPMVTAAFHSGRYSEFAELIRGSRRWILMLALPIFVILLSMPSTLLGFFGRSFDDGGAVLRILAFGQFVNAVAGPVGMILNMIGRHKLVAMAIALTATMNVALNFVVIPAFGAIGAASVTAFSLIVFNGLLSLVLSNICQNFISQGHEKCQ